MADEEQKELFKAIPAYGEHTLKSVILINGGASVALLAFIGNILARGVSTSLASAYSLPLAHYVFGVLAGALATGSSYITQYSYVHFDRKIGVFWHWVSVALVLVAYLLFGLGSFLCYEAIKNTA
jgi:hypothetical protein